MKKSIKSTLLFATTAFAGLLTFNATTSATHAATNNGNGTVTVQSGDTYMSIAKEYNMTTAALETLNGRTVGGYDLIYPGETVKISGATTSTSSNSSAATTNVQAATTTNTSSAASSAASQSSTSAAATSTATSASTTSTTSSSSLSSSDEAAKAWIANKESGGSYTATNGQYIGKYQLSASLLNGDYSASNQESVANSYVTSRYGSWTAAQAFWEANGWY
ncbi:LysM peptidoglycan-binding domain-containing protein [Lactobacillus selangorensis]|uniref:aggregation-promoting factor n=1 Tax=Lactobacillus selangorensis TaxID=81857 RepID=UPI00071028C8|nr:LysM domain-containing protein [Lactobacillus selangorensis]